jgi:hypothetical protein
MEISRTRTQYSRISNTKKKLLINYVICKKIKLLNAAKLLDIKYPTAKTIMRIYRKENKIFTKNYDEEKNLKKIIENRRNFQNNKKEIYFFKNKYNEDSIRMKLVKKIEKGKLNNK